MAAPRGPARRFSGALRRGAWSTLDLGEPGGAGAPGEPAPAAPGGPEGAPGAGLALAAAPPTEACALAARGAGACPARAAAAGLLERCLAGAGWAAQAAQWAAGLEAAAWDGARAGLGAAEEARPARRAAALRSYRAEVRRVGAALRDPAVSRQILARVEGGELSPGDVLALPPDCLLPEAKRARLLELRQGPAEDGGRQAPLPFRDEHMACAECEKVGAVSYCYLTSVREGFNKAETWGSKDSEDRGHRCRARCDECLAEWIFDQ